MALEQLIGKIEGEGATKTAAIRTQADGDAKKQVEEAVKLAAERVTQGVGRLKTDLARDRIRRLAAFETEQNRELLRAKQVCLDAVLADVRERILKMSQDEKRGMLGKLVAKVQEAFPGGGTISTARGDTALIAAPNVFNVVADLDIQFGLKALSADGRFALDLTLETLLQESWSRHMTDIAKTLFE